MPRPTRGRARRRVKPAHVPMSISRQRSSVGAPASPSSSAVWTARVRSEDRRRSGIPSRNGTSASACSRPSSDSGGSAWPCRRCSAFQVDSPWRTSSRRWVTATVSRTAPSAPRSVAAATSSAAPGRASAAAGRVRSHARHSRVRTRTARFHGACDSAPDDGHDEQDAAAARQRRHGRRQHPLRRARPHALDAVAPVGHPRLRDRPERREEAQPRREVARRAPAPARAAWRRRGRPGAARAPRWRRRSARCSWPAPGRR